MHFVGIDSGLEADLKIMIFGLILNFCLNLDPPLTMFKANSINDPVIDEFGASVLLVFASPLRKFPVDRNFV